MSCIKLRESILAPHLECLFCNTNSGTSHEYMQLQASTTSTQSWLDLQRDESPFLLFLIMQFHRFMFAHIQCIIKLCS